MSYELTPPPMPPSPPPVVYPAAMVPPGVRDYGAFALPSRPGVVKAIGVASIVVGSVSLLANLYVAMVLFIFSMSASYGNLAGPTLTPNGPGASPVPAAQQAAPPAPLAPSSPVNAKAVVVSRRGLPSDDRAAVADGLSELRFLAPQRLAQLDALLAEAGRDVFPDDGKPLAAGRVRGFVLGHAEGLSADPKVTGPDTFRTTGGRFELYDNRAVFYPARRGEVVRTSTLTGTNPGLSPEEVETVVRLAQSTSGNVLNPSQQTALRTLLTTPGQQHVSPITLPTAIRAVQQLGDGSVYVSFPNGFASLGPQGQTVTNTTTGPAAAALALAAGGRVRHSGAGMALAGFATLGQFAVAVFLLVIGIATLRESPRGRKLHLLYAGIKIALALTGTAAAWWMATSYHDALMVNTSPQADEARKFATFVGVQALVLGVVALAYPVVLLIALQNREVKDYYERIA